MSTELQPVEIVHGKDHKFEVWGGEGCFICKRAKNHPYHHGYPPSLNALGDGNRFTYRAMKTAWEARFLELLGSLDWPMPLARITAEGEITVPTRIRRDQGNHRFLLEKALGDALVAGGWLEDDDWERFSFGGLEQRYVKGESGLRLVLFPTPIENEDAA